MKSSALLGIVCLCSQSRLGEAGEARAAWCDGIQKMVQSKQERMCEAICEVGGEEVGGEELEEVLIEMSDSQH